MNCADDEKESVCVFMCVGGWLENGGQSESLQAKKHRISMYKD